MDRNLVEKVEQQPKQHAITYIAVDIHIAILGKQNRKIVEHVPSEQRQLKEEIHHR